MINPPGSTYTGNSSNFCNGRKVAITYHTTCMFVYFYIEKLISEVYQINFRTTCINILNVLYYWLYASLKWQSSINITHYLCLHLCKGMCNIVIHWTFSLGEYNVQCTMYNVLYNRPVVGPSVIGYILFYLRPARDQLGWSTLVICLTWLHKKRTVGILNQVVNQNIFNYIFIRDPCLCTFDQSIENCVILINCWCIRILKKKANFP